MLCEKPIGIAVEEVEELAEAVHRSGRLLQVGHMKRFDAGVQSAKAFIDGEMGGMIALKAWYCDNTHRYAMTDAVQPLIVRSANARKPAGDPKADLKRYYMLAHGSHLVDTARYLAGPLVEVEARLSERFGAYCWFVDVGFESGALGHLDLTIPVRMDWHEGFQIYGQNGSVNGEDLQPLVLPVERGGDLSRGDGDLVARARGGRAFLSPAARGAGRRDRGRDAADRRDDRGRRRLGAGDDRDRAVGRHRQAGPARRRVGGALMKLGIFAKTFPGEAPLPVLRAVRAAGYAAVQYNMACSGLGALPDIIPDAAADAVAAAAAETGVEIAAISATYNMTDPDPGRRVAGRAGFAAIAAAAPRIGSRLITVCSGSRDPDDQWRAHPDNDTPAAWDEMIAEFHEIVPVAERHGVMIGVEPELGNVVSSPERARRLIALFPGGPIRIVLDPANLFERTGPGEAAAIVDAAVDLLGPHIALAHAKDRDADGGFATAGRGVVDWPRYLAALRRARFDGALVTHGLTAAEAPGVARFLAAEIA